MNFTKLKEAASGHCIDLLEKLIGAPIGFAEATDDVECPLCGHGSFHAAYKDEDVNAHGRVRCHTYCNEGQPTGDIIDSVKVFGEYDTQGEAARAIMEELGLSVSEAIHGKKPEVDIVEAVARAKRMPVDAFRKFGAIEATRGRSRKKVARVPVYNEDGEIHSHFDLTPNDKGFFKRGTGSSGMFFPGKLPEPEQIWCLVEGPKDAAALVGLGFNAAGLPKNEMAAKYAGLFKGAFVIIVPDLDDAGVEGAHRTGGRLFGLAATVRIARLPGEHRSKSGDDVRDVLKKHGDSVIRKAISEARLFEPSDGNKSADGRPQEIITLRYEWHVENVVKHLGMLGWLSPWIPESRRESRKLYQRGGALVEVFNETRPDATARGGKIKIAVGSPRIRELPTPQLSLRISDACQLVKETGKEEDKELKPIPPPDWLIKGVHSLGDYGEHIRHLECVVTAPTLRPDGTVLQKPGWDASGLLYRPAMKFEAIPKSPTKDEAREAMSTLLDVIADFPCQTEADRSAWAAMVLSMIGRPCISGQVPLFPISANTRGAGKSMLFDTASLIAYGHKGSRTSYVSDDNELRKQITSIVIEGSPAVLLDNVDRPLGGAALDAVLTAERWRDRELGASRTIDLPTRIVWAATGNNIAYRSDIARRVVPIRLASPLERPETRTDFKVANLLEWVADHRGELVTAALTILRAYFVAGCPKQSGGQFGSFESWSDIIRGSIVWTEFADPMDTIESAQADDNSFSIVSGLISGLLELDLTGDGVTCQTILKRLQEDFSHENYPAMREILGEIATKNGRLDARRLGYVLRTYCGRVVDGCQIYRRKGHKKTNLWSVRRVDSGGDGGNSGDTSSPYAGNSRGCHTNQATQQNSCTGGRESSPESPPSPPTKICEKCGSQMQPSEMVVNGWRNWDCLSCGHTSPEQVEGGASCR